MEKYITCWGDSLTAAGGWTARLSELTGLPVYNGGTGGEKMTTIMARQGADAMMVNGITLQSGTEPVTLATFASPFTTYLGRTATPLLQGGAHVNPVCLGGVYGNLTFTGKRYDDETGVWSFTRIEEGEIVKIDRPTAMTTAFDRERNAPYLMIIFMGQNGGYEDISDLISGHRLMMSHAKADYTVILGLSSGTAESRREYELAMKREFGRYFISLREYLSEYGMADAGLTPTDEDKAAMAMGKVPQSLLIDSVHFKSETKIVIGELIYKRLTELGIFSV